MEIHVPSYVAFRAFALVILSLFLACEAVRTEELEPKKEELRYDGKSFEELRAILRAELKKKRRVDAFSAFGAFGANGYGKEATRAFLQAIGKYKLADWDLRQKAAGPGLRGR